MLRRLTSLFAAIGDVQFLPGYSVLLVDEPYVQRMLDLARPKRLSFLSDMDQLGEALEPSCQLLDPGFRRVNQEIRGNTETRFSHAAARITRPRLAAARRRETSHGTCS